MIGGFYGGLCGEDYLDGRLHEHIGGIVDSLGTQLQYRRIAALLGLVHVLIYLLHKNKNKIRQKNVLSTERYIKGGHFPTHLFVARQHRVHELAIESGTASGGRREQPEDEGHFDLIVERQPGEEYVSEGLNAGEKCKNNPVHHPLDLASRKFY